MKRRNFLANTAIGTTGLFSLLHMGCTPVATNNGRTPVSSSLPDDFELNETTIGQLQQHMQVGKYTSRQLVELYLKRIEEIDKAGPTLNSVIEINPDALAIADLMDAERKIGKWRGPMHGIPVLIKDNIDTADKMLTTAGSIALIGNRATKDAFIVTQLRKAGAIILGKTNLSEWANFRSFRSSSGWSSRGGQTRNPYSISRNPGGSSAGSGAAVAANLCTVAVGTETDGSIICPASFNGVVGLKPTVGLLSRSGIIPISKTQDTAGPMARTVADAAILLGALTGIDADDPITTESRDNLQTDYTQCLDIDGLKGKRIGYDASYLKIHEKVDDLFLKTLETLTQYGATMVEIDFNKKMSEAAQAETDVLEFEFKDGLNRYLSTANANVKSLKELVEFNLANEAKAMPFFRQETLESSEKREDLDSKAYQEALKKLLTSRQIINEVMDTNKLDAICGPSNSPTFTTDLINGDHYLWVLSTPAAIAGYPSITVPAGDVRGLPIGLTFYGKAYTEPLLLAIAYSFEQKTKCRIAPAFKNELE